MKRLNSTLKGIISLVIIPQDERFNQVVLLNNSQTLHTANTASASIVFSSVFLR